MRLHFYRGNRARAPLVAQIKDGIKETADFKEVDILTCQGYLHVIDKVLFYDDAGGSDGALGKAVGFSAGAVALGAAFL